MALELVTPTLIENTTMYKYLNSEGIHKTYRITPNDGYVLHDKSRDWTDLETEELKLGYTTGTASCAANYDFTVNPREFYAVPENSVPADQIFGGGNDHEVM